MRRYSLYLTMAILTFGFGVFVSFNFILRKEIRLIKPEVTEIVKQEIELETDYQIKEKQKLKFTCADEDIVNLQSLLKTKEFLDRYESDEFLRGYVEVDSIDCSELYEVKKVDLNDNGDSEIILRGNIYGLCGMRGNCAFWIFEKNDGSYQTIFSDEEKVVFDYEIKKEKTNKYKNIHIGTNSSNGDPAGYLTILKFKGKNYRPKECFVEEHVYETKSTKVRRQKC